MRQVSLLYIFIIFGELPTRLLARDRGDHWWRSGAPRHDDRFPSQASNGFEYSILDENYESTHFRKEQRDENGVVRGSYGFKDPSGIFRLVRYIADEKGFRAQISSNEQGVGSQNPANVNIQRLNQPLMIDNEESSIDSHFTSTGRFPESHHEKQGKGQNPLRYDLYTPFMPKYDRKNEDAHKKNSAKNHPYQSNTWMRDKNSGAPISVHSSEDVSYSSRLRPFSGIPGENNFPYPIRNKGVILPQNIKIMQNVLGYPISADKDESEHQFQMPIKEYLPYKQPNPIFLRPQMKVHTNLPDCDKVSSAILCKPPYLFSRNNEYYNTSLQTRNAELDLQINGDESIKKNIDLSQQEIEAILAEKLLKLAESGDESLPAVSSLKPFLFPHNFTYLNKLDQNKQNENSRSSKDAPCSDNHYSLRDMLRSRYLTEDLTVTTSLKRPILYNAMSGNPSIGSLLHGGWNEPMDFNYMSIPNRNLLYDLMKDPAIIAHYINLNKYNVMKNKKNVILLAKQNSPETSTNTILSFLEKLNELGFTISPKQDKESNLSVSKVSDQNSEKEVKNATEPKGKTVINDKSSEFNKNFLNDTAVEKHNETKPKFPVTNLPQTVDNGTTQSLKMQPTVVYESTSEVPYYNESKNPFYDSKFVIFDELEEFEKGKEYSLNEEDKNFTQSNSTDWKKMLDEEINQEYQRTSMQRQSYFSNFPKLEPNVSSDTVGRDERIYKLHDQPAPLYDSRGVTVKPENVPLHLHRYVPPTGITSFPWKFAIPRPAPPRSVIVPPKPPTLT